MPIGVPKVPFEDSEDDFLYEGERDNCLYSERILFLNRKINNELTTNIISLLLYLSSEDDDEDVTMFINSPGGFLQPGLAIYDTMQSLPMEIRTVGLGMVASTASLILAGGETEKRYAFPHARIMIHQPAGGTLIELPSELVLDINELLSLRERVLMEYAYQTGKDPEILSRDMERDYFMSAQEAKDYGIIDRILTKNREDGNYR
uniref:Clp protease proteolytic subunit n=1 Tax=Cratoxylum pruniflorum TaxID=1137046 RepID=UPI001EA7A0BD|nr:Clp protease proteolytic subunit [Cratoxylum pruniflorum]UER39342.1 clp protease proteolytic subunit [Cratoxylum cochinchinense]UNQ86848.1 Clp protease proteolytic subunit [Cratoxylum pruniflorum]